MRGSYGHQSEVEAPSSQACVNGLLSTPKETVRNQVPTVSVRPAADPEDYVGRPFDRTLQFTKTNF